jgi:hypothetical protein
MQAKSIKNERRQRDRMQAVLPVRVRGVDASGQAFEELAHTLDLTPAGARLGAIRRQLNTLDTLVVFYRQRRMEFKVIWTKLRDGKNEYHVGLQSLALSKEGWGMNVFSAVTESVKPQAVGGAA